MTQGDPPDANTVEVSLFGPGVGESVAIHLGSGDWVVVDSCRGRGSSHSAPVEYLRGIGVDLATQVKLVVATHAHDDHIQGLAELFEACESAEFAHPEASGSVDFYTLLEIDRTSEGQPRAYAEYAAVLDLMLERKGRLGRIPRLGAKEGTLLFRRPSVGSQPEAEVLALAPSDAAVALAIQEFGLWREVADENPRRIASRDPNTFCVALWVQVGEVGVLLGSDLLIGPGTDCGWRGVLISPLRPEKRASCYKVPHHGAPNGDHPQVWSDLLTANPVALVAPYRAGRTPRPQLTDCSRICSLTDRAYITSKAGIPAQPDAVHDDAARLRSIARNVRLARGFMGQVRARRSATDASADWTIELFAVARPLCESP